ncbi:hypothetical protein EDD21DRAFT_387500 [Dissophora ornata]|nr:hypothetical protein EDD21DRAFT_387500 [Dissophora ornata]
MILSSIAIGIAAVVTGVVTAPTAFVATVGMLGFGALGIGAGSWAAKFMASYGGKVAAGSACATLQSIGAAGLSAAAKAIVGFFGAVAAGVAARLLHK